MFVDDMLEMEKRVDRRGTPCVKSAKKEDLETFPNV